MLIPELLDEEDIEQIEMILEVEPDSVVEAHHQQYVKILYDWYTKVIQLNKL